MPPSALALPASTVALFRYQVVSSVLADVAAGRKRARAVRRAADTDWWFDGQLERVSKRTVYRWLATFEDKGIEGLEPAPRKRTSSSEVLSSAFLAFLASEKELDDQASIPELIDRAREEGVLEAGEKVDRVTAWRAACRMGLPVQKQKTVRGRDARRYRYPHRMQLVLCDGKHFRAGPGRLRRMVYFFLDNATRYGLHAVVGTSESGPLFLRGLYETILRFGLFDIAYLDHGPGFIATDAARVISNMERLLIHGAAKYPEAHGAIERFNRTAKAKLLRSLVRPDVDPTCLALERRAQHFLREVYNHKPHEAFGGKESPSQRWNADPRQLRMPDSDAELRSKFLVPLTRRVSKDNVISFRSVDFEVPRGHATRTVTLHRQVLDDTLHLLQGEELVALHPVDLAANATAARAANTGSSEPASASAEPPPRTAADLAYQRDFAPVVGPDGGFTEEE